MKSLWTENVTMPRFDSLKGDGKTDVLIIGGGMAGVLCAYMLAQAGVDYMLVEAETICGGITANTTAKLTAQHGLIYGDLIRKFGTERAQAYLGANQAALDKYRALCGGIDCDFEEKDAYVYTLSKPDKIEAEAAALQKLGIAAEVATSLPLPLAIASAVKFPRQAQFHPLKFAAAIAKGLRIYEHTPVRELIGTAAVTPNGRISAKSIIAATHFPFLNKHGSYFLKLYQHRSYVMALKHAPDVGGMYVDEAEKGMSFRNYAGMLFVGGGGHRTGKQGGGWNELQAFARRHCPDAVEVRRWATQDCMTLDGVPYIGRYSGRTQDLYVATGFNKWGMTTSMAAAMLLSDMVQGRAPAWADVFSPSRSILRPQLAVNAFEATASLLTPTPKRCPHMGCALKWNRQEHTWDCPCHGSRFAEDGRLLDNPATGDLRQ